MSRTLNQIIKDQAYEVAVDYKPWEEDLSPKEYFQAGFSRGATWVAEYASKLVPIKMWTVKVFEDHEVFNGPRIYRVPAATARDAQLMAFILDEGLEVDKYGRSATIERGVMELARMHTEVMDCSIV